MTLNVADVGVTSKEEVASALTKNPTLAEVLTITAVALVVPVILFLNVISSGLPTCVRYCKLLFLNTILFARATYTLASSESKNEYN